LVFRASNTAAEPFSHARLSMLRRRDSDGMSLGEECSCGVIASNPAQPKILWCRIYFFFETLQPLPHQQAIDGIEIIVRQDFEHRVSMLLVKTERRLVIDRNLKRYVIATGLLQFGFGRRH
jgi:hypothetical protein